MLAQSGAALLALVACALLAAMSTAQDPDAQWFWIMADSTNSTAVCPGRCLAVNDSVGTGVYTNKPVGFVVCKTADSDANYIGESSPTYNANQQWLRFGDGNEAVIKINATGGTDDQTTPPQLLCLQPDPVNQSLTVAKCSEKRNQKWIVADDSIASLAFTPPRYLAMSYRLGGFLDPTDGNSAWREATIVPVKAHNSSVTTTFSMVDGTLDDPHLQPPSPDNEPPDSRNFIRNGGFELSSSDFSSSMSNLTLSQNDIFGLCGWQIMKTEANLQGVLNREAAPPEGNRSLYLKDGIVKQTVALSPGAFYRLSFKVHVVTPSPDESKTTSGSESDNCNGSDTFTVNPFPSTDVYSTVTVGNGSWTTKHVSFQSLAEKVNLCLRGCATCGCFVDDINLMQVIDYAPFPPPPPRPSPPRRPGLNRGPFPGEEAPPGFLGRRWRSDRLSNGAVVGLVVGAAALFFVIGAAFFGVVCVKEKKERETEMRRPPEWSIQTTTPAQSERERRSGRNSHSEADGSNAPTSQSSAPQPSSSLTS